MLKKKDIKKSKRNDKAGYYKRDTRKEREKITKQFRQKRAQKKKEKETG